MARSDEPVLLAGYDLSTDATLAENVHSICTHDGLSVTRQSRLKLDAADDIAVLRPLYKHAPIAFRGSRLRDVPPRVG